MERKPFSRTRLVKLLNLLRVSKNISPGKVAADLKISRHRYVNLFMGAFTPSIADAVAVALYFGVSLDWLLAAAKPKTDLETACEKVMGTENGN